MKNKTQHTTHKQGQSLRNILYVWDGIHRNQKLETLKMSETLIEDNIFLIQNKGKGPPGRSRSPGVGDGLFPDHPPDGEVDQNASPLSFKREGQGVSQKRFQFINTEYQTNYYKNRNANILQTLNFTNMKKQILFLAFFILAALASITDTYGQALPSTFPPRTLTGCDDYPLHPLPGKSYLYEVSQSAGDVVTSYTWWATKDPNFINTADGSADLTNMLDVTAGELLDKSSNYGVSTAAASGSTVSITWTPAILANTLWQGPASTTAFPSPTFVVVKADGDCTNNLQVYEINPLKAFVVDIANWDNSTTTTLPYGDTSSSCVDKVRGASYDDTNKTVLMDYGTNTITFEVIAANFVNTWKPTFTIVSGLSGDQTAQIGWAYTQAAAAAGTWVDSSTTGLTTVTTTNTWAGTESVTTNETNTAAGVSIWVTVVITNNTFESLATQPFTLAVDGIDETAQWDLMADCTDSNAVDLNDQATQDLLPRPTVDDDTVDPLADPDTFIPRQH